MTNLLIVDTCALLDIVRFAARDTFHPSYAERCLEVLNDMQSPNSSVRILVSDLVRDEYQRNITDVTADAQKLLRKTLNQYSHALKVVGHLSGIPAVLPNAGEDWVNDSVDRARQIAEAFIGGGMIEATTDVDKSKGLHRVMTGTAPSRRGKDSTADCIITEFALRLARSPAAGVASTVFLSSNTQEYCEAGKLKPELQTEFHASGLVYVRNWGEAAAAVLPKAAAA